MEFLKVLAVLGMIGIILWSVGRSYDKK